MANLVFIRHSIPEVDPAQPAKRWKLGDHGVQEAEKLVGKLASFGLAALASSPEPKAAATAQAIARQLELPVTLDDRLREHDRSNVGYLARGAFRSGVLSIFETPDSVAFGTESAADVFSRMSAAVAQLQSEPAGDVGFVSHGTAIDIYLSKIAGIDPVSLWTAIPMPAAIVRRGGAVEVIAA